jgi:hypothetical protein
VSYYALISVHVPEICESIFVDWKLETNWPAVRLPAKNAPNLDPYGSMDAPSCRCLRNAVRGPTAKHTALSSKV